MTSSQLPRRKTEEEEELGMVSETGFGLKIDGETVKPFIKT